MVDEWLWPILGKINIFETRSSVYIGKQCIFEF